MSELIDVRDTRATIRWKLLTTASAFALTAYISSGRAEDSDRPTVWMEMGGQVEMMQGTSSPFTAPFMFPATVPEIYGKNSFAEKQQPPRFGFGGDAKITFQPEDSDWIFSAGIRYGRSHGKRHTHYQTSGVTTQIGIYYSGVLKFLTAYPPGIQRDAEAFSDTKAKYSEHHMVLDFSVGKDVGIGLLGHEGTSSVNVGVRSVDFTQASTVSIFARPKITLVNVAKYPVYFPHAEFDEFKLKGHTQRSFNGLGPSVSWNASADLAGNSQDGEFTLDWGINASLLFGRQKAKTDHSTQATHYNNGKYFVGYTPLYPMRNIDSPPRSRRVTVPNVGGFAGISLKWPNAKISVGYRGDIFFKAIDRGIDVRKDSNLTFNGPYASVSFGVGD